MPYKSKEQRQKHNREQRAKERAELKALRIEVKELRVDTQTYKTLEERAKEKGLSVTDYVSSLLAPLIHSNDT